MTRIGRTTAELMADGEAQRRLTKFETMARKPGVDVKALHKMFKAEKNKDIAKKMQKTLIKLEKEKPPQKRPAGASASMVSTTTPSTPSHKDEDPKEAELRLKKFNAMVKQKQNKSKVLEKMHKTERNAKNKAEMARALKKLQSQLATESSSSSTSSMSTSTPAATPLGGSAKLLDPNASKKRLKDFVMHIKKGKVDLKKLEKMAATEKDPMIKQEMKKELMKARKLAAKK